MNFDFDDTQYAVGDLARELFARSSPPSRLRELAEGKRPGRDVWAALARAGLCGLAVPEPYGGGGGSELDLALVWEEAGRAALPEPLFETAGLAAPLIARYGSEEVRSTWLPAIATGEVLVAVALPAPSPTPWGAEADLVLALDGEDVVLAPGHDVEASSVPSPDPTRPAALVRVKGGERLLGAATALLERGRAGTASLLVGVARHLLDMSVSYARERHQFGRPIGANQAIKHKLASMHVALESAQPAVWFAAYAVARDLPGAGVAAVVAKIAANRAEALCNSEALQCHGGIGFTWEHDLHFWLKRGMAWRRWFGTSTELRREFLRLPLEDFL